MSRIEPLSKGKLSRYSQLRLKKHRDAERLFVAEGEKSVSELLPVFEAECVVATPAWLESNARKLHPHCPAFSAPADRLRRISSMATPPEVLAILRQPEPTMPVLHPDTLYIALDGVQDPGNLGTIIRTADWFGVDTIFASPATVDVFNAKTVQATMGSLARVKVVYTDLAALFDAHRDIPVYGTLLDGDDIYTTPLSEGGFLVMGNEGNGLTPRIREMVSHKLLLPPYPLDNPHAESLNVGVATALVTAEFRRRTLSQSNG